MLQVFASDEDRQEVYSQLKLIEGYNCRPSGLTPPTKNIIKRKYVKTRMHKERPVMNDQRYVNSAALHAPLLYVVYRSTS